jgi:thiol:disulfide interchange protein DsbD
MKILISLALLIFVFSSCQQAPTHRSKFPWKPYSKQALQDALEHKKSVVIDFFAEWCPICHELDDTLFSRPEIQAKLSQVTALRVDATNQDDPAIQEILQEYNVDGLPTIIFLDSHGKEINNSRVIGFVTPEEFSQALALFNILK